VTASVVPAGTGAIIRILISAMGVVPAVVPAGTGAIIRILISTMGVTSTLVAGAIRVTVRVIVRLALACKCRACKGADRENGNGRHKKLLHGYLPLSVRYQKRTP
jgi:hypothetical protein